tara:strand:+ start:1007 stop:1816 length:810 start_codon:yes stop_codon:yes gene_type:complete
MKIFINKRKLKKFVENEKELGFVPTMGNLHKGHISLFKRSLSECRKTIATIFVNKPQFNKKNDYLKYPRTINNDIKILKKLKIDYLYIPGHKDIYPFGPNKKIKINYLEKKLCGKFRPGHFRAVVDVVDKFINIIKPKKIYFGEKDMQQLKIIEDYVKKKYDKITIVGCKTVREKNGIPFSSRNNLLSTNEKIIASKIYKILVLNKKYLIKKFISMNRIRNKIFNLGVKKIDYITLLDVNKLTKPYKKNKRYKIFVAYYLRTTRLIDNI